MAISLADFLASGWKQALEEVQHEGYLAMWGALSDAARTAIEQGRNEHGKVLWLLADACSMMLSPSSRTAPFKPLAVFHDRRSVAPEDLLATDIQFFEQVVDSVDDDWLKARLADLIWLKGSPRNAKYALAAIDAYRRLPLDEETWVRGGRDCWPRAISLAQMLRAGAGDRLEQMQASISVALNAATKANGFLAVWLADLLKTYGMGRPLRTDIAKKLEALARQFEADGDLHRAREYFSAAADWHRLVPDEAKAAEMTAAVAESWVKEAIARSASAMPSHMAAASCYENAIQTYRTIPRSERPTHRVDERIGQLRTHLNDAGEKSLGEMAVFESPSIDISHIVETARKSVAGKSAQAALQAFANVYRGVNVEQLRDGAMKRMREHPFLSLMAATVMSSDGRVIAKRPSMSLGAEPTEDDEIAIRAEMIRDYGVLIGIVVQGDVLPALEVLLLEQRLREYDFVALAHQSPIVPKARAKLFGKALFAGYEGDFVTALHILIPQVEHLVRMHLKQAGAKTTNIDRDGIENENGMSTLMELPEAEHVFGKALAFEFRSLFCDAFGPNLRNELAHGLLDEDACNSPSAIYAWWLIFRLTFNAWWNVAHKSDAVEQPTEPAP
ncbi:DUF4209 domain-containing protein [Ralstonia wenshanensis]|uniref:DUF4209 domain-containing protein n=1 Tax=Ralstonia wenshanensis TaxID=2842456 RepID=UPI002931572E|nr:DUF4209 domain-containing protein [Ralstonia wenshanensis]